MLLREANFSIAMKTFSDKCEILGNIKTANKLFAPICVSSL